MAKWVVKTKGGDYVKLAGELGVSPVVARLIRNRDVETAEEMERYLRATPEELYGPELLKDAEKAAACLLEAAGSGEKIRVLGDYDIDGVCSSHILAKALKRCGAWADAAIPDRIRDGYGINEELIRRAREDGIDLILTCDNGIAAYDQIAYAAELGMEVIVTDHHEVPYDLNDEGEKIYRIPPALAVVDPKRPDCPYPFKGLCGAAVAYKLTQLLYRQKAGELKEKEPEKAEAFETAAHKDLREMFEIAAFATVGDVMELKGENRIFVKYGLKAMRDSANPGIRALAKANELSLSGLSAYHIGFVLGPCVNATGRLDTAKRALSLFQAQTDEEAVSIALELKQYNEERKAMTQRYLEEAFRIIGEQGLNKDRVLVVYLPDCHESIAGIIAGRIREAFYKPVFVLTRSENGVKGSGRSIDAYHMFEEMSKCKELFTKYGGHRQAAGLSMEEGSVEEFRRRLNELCTLTEEDLTEKLLIDMQLPLSFVTEELVLQLEQLEPFGMGNRKPLFAQKGIRLRSGSIVGRKKNAMKFVMEDESLTVRNGIYFGDAEKLCRRLSEKFGEDQVERLLGGRENRIEIMAAYYPSVNEYRGRREVQVVVSEVCV